MQANRSGSPVDGSRRPQTAKAKERGGGHHDKGKGQPAAALQSPQEANERYLGDDKSRIGDRVSVSDATFSNWSNAESTMAGTTRTSGTCMHKQPQLSNELTQNSNMRGEHH